MTDFFFSKNSLPFLKGRFRPRNEWNVIQWNQLFFSNFIFVFCSSNSLIAKSTHPTFVSNETQANKFETKMKLNRKSNEYECDNRRHLKVSIHKFWLKFIGFISLFISHTDTHDGSNAPFIHTNQTKTSHFVVATRANENFPKTKEKRSIKETKLCNVLGRSVRVHIFSLFLSLFLWALILSTAPHSHQM